VLEGIRYVRNQRALLPTVFAKAGELMIGPSWVIFTVMGANEFAVHWHNVDPARGSMLGMSILLGGRGVGALVGPLISARWAGRSDRRLRLGIFFGYLTVGLGYGALGTCRTVWLASACAMLAHAGGSTVWVFSTTLLQLHTDDRFRGRVFSADLGFSMLTIAAGAYLCGRLLDLGVTARTVATWTGIVMLIPSALWALTMRNIRSIFAAIIKSLSVRPSTLCVHSVISTLPHASKKSGWCPCSSANAPTRLTNSSACAKSGNLNSRRR
jgi:hypothetical protein